MMNLVAGYPKQEQVQLRAQAEQHANRLTLNNSDPYLSVTACRELCREVTENKGTIYD
jgi:hypothetical protein